MNCEICIEKYNDKENKPYSLIPCGHSFCIKCINRLKVKQCPKCRIEINAKLLNRALIDLLDLNLIQDTNYELKIAIKKSTNEFNELKEKFYLKLNQKQMYFNDKIIKIEKEIDLQSNKIVDLISLNKNKLLNELSIIKDDLNIYLKSFFESVETDSKNDIFKLELAESYEEIKKSKKELDLKLTSLDKFELVFHFDSFNHDENSYHQL